MRGENHPSKIGLRDGRERTIERLTAAFVADELTLEQYEQRVDAAYGCSELAALQALISDLGLATTLARQQAEPALLVPAAPSGAGLARVERGAARAQTRTVAILGNVERRGLSGRAHEVLSVLGNVELDLRTLELPPGVTTLHVRAVFGNVEITVPPDMFIESDGAGILGSFGHVSRVPSDGEGADSVLRITGKAVFGNVEIRTRPRDLAERPPRLLPSG